jgi:hypothetical protein
MRSANGQTAHLHLSPPSVLLEGDINHAGERMAGNEQGRALTSRAAQRQSMAAYKKWKIGASPQLHSVCLRLGSISDITVSKQY